MIHKLSDTQSKNIGHNTNIWQFTVVLEGATIGDNCNICANCFIENDVKLGNNVTIKNGVQIWDGLTIEDDVFIGPNVTFTNDLLPRSLRRESRKEKATFAPTVVKQGASIGANSTIICGLTIGEYAMIGAGSVVTKDIPPFTLWYGSPATVRGEVNEQGEIVGKS